MLDKIALQRSTFLLGNEIINSDFSDGKTGWYTSGYQAEFDVVDGLAKTTNTESNTRSLLVHSYVSEGIDSDDIVYVAANVKADNVESVDFFNIIFGLARSHGYLSFPLTDKIERISGTGVWGEGRNLRFFLQEKSSIEEKPLLYLKSALLINLTKTFGKGNEPTTKQMDELLSQFDDGWFDGTKNVFNAEHMLKMYFNKTKELDNAITSLGGSV